MLIRPWFLAVVTSSVLALGAGCANTGFDPGDGGGTGTSDGSGAGGGDGGGPVTPSCPGQETILKGTVYAPNGQDPVPGASVFVPASVPELFVPEVKCEVCGTFGTADNLWFTTTEGDGTFEMTVCPGQRVLVFQNGRFRRVHEINVPPATTLEVPNNVSRLPRRNGENHSADAVPKIAVATGDFDKMECVLRKMGLDDSAFDLYEGADQLKSPNKPLPNFNTLLGDLNKLKSYNIVFINCTNNTFEAELTKPAVRQNLEEYVKSGGRLYITDWSYDWIEQLGALAPFIDFEPGPSGDAPEKKDAAAIGMGGLTVSGTVKDTKMAEWLALFPSTISNNKVKIEHFLVDWVIMHKLHKDVKVWVEGNIQSGDGSINGTRPLTVTYNFKNCGKILFSSYHTEGRDDELGLFPDPKPYPQYCGASASPQDRILEYLIFDIANCVKPIQ